MNTLLNKALFVSASTFAALGLLLAAPQAASAQEGVEDAEFTETEAMTPGIVRDSEVTESDAVGQSFEMEDGEGIDSDVDGMDSDDIDSDVDADYDEDIESETYSAPTYSDSPRALW